jgi:hypothetical protein
MLKRELYFSMNLVAILLLYVTTGNYQKAIQTKHPKHQTATICTKVKMTLSLVLGVLKTKSFQSDHSGTKLN